MVTTDDTGRCVAANEAAVAISGYTIDELRGMPSCRLLSGEATTDEGSRLQLLLPASAFLPANAVLRTKSRASVPVHITSAENKLSAAAQPAAHEVNHGQSQEPAETGMARLLRSDVERAAG
jgi:PAS domain-containing protein